MLEPRCCLSQVSRSGSEAPSLDIYAFSTSKDGLSMFLSLRHSLYPFRVVVAGNTQTLLAALLDAKSAHVDRASLDSDNPL